MTKSEEIRREQELADTLRPWIVARLRERSVERDIAEQIEREHGVDAAKAYRWVAYIAEDFERRRRRNATIGLAMLWPGAFIAVGGPLAVLLGADASVRLGVLGVAIGVPLVIAGATLAFGARGLVRRSI